MDDLIVAHAENVASANLAHMTATDKAAADADEAIRKRIGDFGHRIVEIIGTFDEARAALINDVNAIVLEMKVALAGAFAEAQGEIAASQTMLQRKMAARTEFLATGKLPVDDPLPKLAANDRAEQPPAPPVNQAA